MFGLVTSLWSHVFALEATASHTAVPYVIRASVDTGKLLIVLTALFGALLAHPRTRRVTLATVKFTNRHSPRWAKPAMVACAFFPGQADEILLVAILLVPILRNARTRHVFTRTIRYAWNVR